MNEVNYDEMKRMQAAAERRVGEMNRRSRLAVESFNGNGAFENNRNAGADDTSGSSHFTPVRDAPTPKNIKMPVEFPNSNGSVGIGRTTKPVQGEKPHFVYEPPSQNRRASTDLGMRTNVYGKNSGVPFLGGLSKDETERLFLLSLCMLLKNENADEEMIAALMYIMT